MPSFLLESKHDKYNTSNPISKFLIKNFFSNIKELTSVISFKNIIDIGCGEGLLLNYIRDELLYKNVFAMDIDPAEISTAQNNIPQAGLMVASAYNLPFTDNQFDLLICTEVMEHLEEPKKALNEFHRITSKFCILSVPNEPLWRFLNVVRGSYIHRLGNTPGHLRHWSINDFINFISSKFEILKVETPLPWIIALCIPKDKD